ncbi:hypothetical protein [Phytohabitans rumicis]|uniref:hypothetical protein n=1 Tax=Phytohabitans rumicis TaxID=1076125 RepID=UPI001566E449|nr:hypothetical protein [Phytohabitans rumicis]
MPSSLVLIAYAGTPPPGVRVTSAVAATPMAPTAPARTSLRRGTGGRDAAG